MTDPALFDLLEATAYGRALLEWITDGEPWPGSVWVGPIWWEVEE